MMVDAVAEATEIAVDAGTSEVTGEQSPAQILFSGDSDNNSTEEVDVVEQDTAAVSEESKTEGDTTEDGDKADKVKPDADAPLTEYAEFEMPEGFELDSDILAEFTPIALEQGLSQEQAQTLMNMHISAMSKQVMGQEEARVKAETVQAEAWVKEVKDDPTYGGANFEKSSAKAAEFRNAYGDEALSELVKTPIGNHPALFKLFAHMGSILADDSIHLGAVQSGSQRPRTAAQTLYPDQNKI
jgi:hypothetical protein